MLDQDILLRLLQQYPLLRQLPAEESEKICSTASLLQLAADTVVFDELQPCKGFPMVLSGSIRVIKSSANGRELQLYRIVPGESCILTSSCLLGHTRYQARGITEGAVEMVVLPPQCFYQLISCYEPFRHYVFNLFSERMTDLMELISAVAFQKLDQRLASLLATKSSPLFVTHQVLADELGCAREIVSRLLKGFAGQGWVHLGREQIEIKNLRALQKFAAL